MINCKWLSAKYKEIIVRIFFFQHTFQLDTDFVLNRSNDKLQIIKKDLPLQKDLNTERFPYCSLNGFFDFFFVDFESVPLKRIYIETMKVRSHHF